MTRKRFVLSVAAAMALGAFTPGFAQDSSYNVSPNVGVDANASSGVNTRSGDVNSSSTTEQGASTEQGMSSSSSTSVEGDERAQGKARGHEEDKRTGLDRADQVAGERGQHGRDNAREKQGLN